MLPMAEDNGLVWTFATVGALVSMGFLTQSERNAGSSAWQTMQPGCGCGSRSRSSTIEHVLDLVGVQGAARQAHKRTLQGLSDDELVMLQAEVQKQVGI